MAILQKDWHQPYTYQLLTRAGTSYERTRNMLFFIKQGLLSHPTSPWTVVASGNESVASLADNWSAYTDVLRGYNDTDPGSWIVLKSPAGYYPELWLLLDYTTPSVDYRSRVYLTTVEPDISSLSPYRVPEIVGPSCGRDEVQLQYSTGSGHYKDFISMVVAADGSFVVTGPSDPYRYSTRNMWWPAELNLFFFNRMRDTNPLDPYGFALGMSNADTNCLVNFSGTTWSGANIHTIHPDGEEALCAAVWPGTGSASELLMMRDDYWKNWRPQAWPIEILSVTTDKESKKGTLEDMWWGSRWAPCWGQPGFEGEDMVAMQKGILWLPCNEPYRW